MFVTHVAMMETGTMNREKFQQLVASVKGLVIFIKVCVTIWFRQHTQKEYLLGFKQRSLIRFS